MKKQRKLKKEIKGNWFKTHISNITLVLNVFAVKKMFKATPYTEIKVFAVYVLLLNIYLLIDLGYLSFHRSTTHCVYIGLKRTKRKKTIQYSHKRYRKEKCVHLFALFIVNWFI